jgi:ABC-type lipoprotein release transport system permease subunit
MALNDVVIVNAADAGLLLGLEPGWASDLAVDVFHSQEAEALLPDLAAAFPWPVRITSRSETLRIYASGAYRRSGIAVVTMVPAVLSLCLLMAACIRERIGRRHEVGLLKALGWTTGDIVRFQVFRSVFIGLPGTAAGMLVAMALVFSPGIRWPGYLYFGWQTAAPALYLEMNPAAWVLLAVVGLVLLPFMAASLAAALQSAAVDPQEILEREN